MTARQATAGLPAAQTLGFLVLGMLAGVSSDGQQSGWTKTVAELTPTYYLLRACRTAVNGTVPHLADVAVLGRTRGTAP